MRMLILLILFLSFKPACANVFDWRLWSADAALQADEFTDAKEKYLKMQVKEPENARLNYNMGVSQYRLGTYIPAINNFARAAEQSKNKMLQTKAFHNLGNANFKIEKYQEAVSAYEAALAISPDDEDTKHNLELAKKKLEEKKQDNKDDKKKDDQKKDEKQDKKDDQSKDGNNDEDQENDQLDQEQKNKPQNKNQQNQQRNQPKQQKSKAGLSKQDIERLLMQVQEAKPQDVQQGMGAKKNSSSKARLNPW